MSEGAGGDLAKLGERFTEGVPGFAVVAIVLGAVLPFVFSVGAEGPSASGHLKMIGQALPVISLILAWIGYFLGHYLDPLLFDPVWGSPGIHSMPNRLRRILAFDHLDESRTKLADHWKCPVTGIFAKAQDLMSKSEVWEKKIKWPLEWSKAFRSLAILGVVALASWDLGQWIVPILFFSFVLLFVRTAKGWTAFKNLVFGITLASLLTRLLLSGADPPQRRMFHSLIFGAVVLVSAGLYLVLRIRHVKTLYESAQNLELEERSGMLCAGYKIVALRNVLLTAADAVPDDEFQKIDHFVQSRALMHVKLSTIRGSLPPLKFKTKIQLFKNEVEPVQPARHVYASPHFNLDDPYECDLVIEYLNQDAPGENELSGFDHKINGVI